MADLGDLAEYDVQWRAFLLDPHFAAEGEDIGAYYARRFGSQAPALRQRLHDSGKWDGAFFADWRWRPNTLAAHQLIALAGRSRRSHDAAGLLFRKTYEEGANLSSREVVLQAACELGLLRDEGEAWLGSPEAQAAVAADDGEAKARRGITSVPTFLISSGHSKEVQLVGAESVRAFEVAFRKVLHEAGGTPTGPPHTAGGEAKGKEAAAAGAAPAKGAAAEE